MLTRLLLRALDGVSPDRRRRWAVRIAVWTAILWAASHVGLLLLPQWFFEHVLLTISWGAIFLTAIDVVSATDARAADDPDSPVGT